VCTWGMWVGSVYGTYLDSMDLLRVVPSSL
jgi:hypothetical protein